MTVRSARLTAKFAGREAASSRWLQLLARVGLLARGLNYMLVGLLAVEIARGAKGDHADSAGALHAIAGRPGGFVVLSVGRGEDQAGPRAAGDRPRPGRRR